MVSRAAAHGAFSGKREDVDLARLGVVGVTRVEERGLALGPQHHPEVVDARDELVDDRVPLADRGQLDGPDVRRLPRGQVLRGEVRGDQLPGRLRVGQQPGLGVGVEQGAAAAAASTWSACWWVTTIASRSVRSWKPGENVPGSMRIRWSAVSTRRQACPR